MLNHPMNLDENDILGNIWTIGCKYYYHQLAEEYWPVFRIKTMLWDGETIYTAVFRVVRS